MATPEEPGKNALIDGLASAGLIQFGQFRQADGALWPVWVNLRMAASYPDLLAEMAGALAPLVDGAGNGDERLLCTAEAIPLGVALSLRTGRPLVYAWGADRAYTSAFVFEGAYDVGHTTILVTDVLIDAPQARAMASLAARVGLVVTRVIAVLDLELGARAELASAGFEVRAVLALREVLPRLAAGGRLPEVMRKTVEAWMGSKGDGG